jgi:hypothetical protein
MHDAEMAISHVALPHGAIQCEHGVLRAGPVQKLSYYEFFILYRSFTKKKWSAMFVSMNEYEEVKETGGDQGLPR